MNAKPLSDEEHTETQRLSPWKLGIQKQQGQRLFIPSAPEYWNRGVCLHIPFNSFVFFNGS